MLDGDADVRLLTALTGEERQELLNLMEGHRPHGRELFRQWLRIPVAGMYAAILKVEGRPVGFAATSLNHGWRLGMVGVFIAPAYRGRGLAAQALNILLAAIALLPPEERPEYFVYENDKARLFRPPIERHGFKDIFRHRDEYAERCRRATTIREAPQGGSQ